MTSKSAGEMPDFGGTFSSKGSAKCRLKDKQGNKITTPDGSESMWIELWGPDSDVAQALRGNAGSAIKDILSGDAEATEKARKKGIENLAKLTKDWLLINPSSGEIIKTFPCTVENAVKLYSSDPGLFDSLREFQGKRENFS